MKFTFYSREAAFLLFILSYLFLLSSDAQGQGNNTISGFVFGVDRQPVTEVSVELLDEYNRLITRTRTASSGRYSFFRLTQGRYYIRVLPIGTNYEEQTKDVEIVNFTRQSSSSGTAIVSGTENKQEDFYLRTNRNSTNSSTVNGVIFAQEIPKNAQKIYEKATSDLKDKKTDEGISELKNAIEIFPNYYLALERLGFEYINQQKFAEAREVLTKAAEINPRNFENLYSLGFALYKLKSYTQAVETLKKAVEINSSSVNSLFLLGVNLRQIKKYKEAEESLKKAEKLSSSSSDIHWQLALLYTNDLKNYTAAADQLELFLKAKPNFEEVEKVRGLIKMLREKAKT